MLNNLALLLIPAIRDFSWVDALDIFLVAILLFQLYNLVKGTVAINILLGIFTIYIVWKMVELTEMKLLSEILGKFIGVGAIAIIIVFQQELRRFLLYVGTSEILNSKPLKKTILRFPRKKKSGIPIDLPALIRACRNMGESKTGALIIISSASEMDFYIQTGEPIDSRVSARMLESIFFKNNPLHDGAVIIVNNRIKAARCVLPVTEDQDFPSQLGMRHRAAAGITENTDAVAIVVSEQTGSLSFSKNGKLYLNLSLEQLRERIERSVNN